MEEVNKVQEPLAAPQTPDDIELQKIYQEFLQKCCEVGQIRYNLDQLNSQRLELEKTLELAERAAKSAANKHRELQKVKFSKLKSPDQKLELKEAH